MIELFRTVPVSGYPKAIPPWQLETVLSVRVISVPRLIVAPTVQLRAVILVTYKLATFWRWRPILLPNLVL